MMSMQDLYKALSLLATAIAMMVSYNVPASGAQTPDELVPLQTVSDVPVTQSTPTLPTPTGRTTYPTAPITPPAETAPLEDGDVDDEQTGDDATGGDDGDTPVDEDEEQTGGEDDGDTPVDGDANGGDDDANGDEPVEGGDEPVEGDEEVVEGDEPTEEPTETPMEEPTEEPTEDTGGEDPQIVEVSDDAAPAAPAPEEGNGDAVAPSGDTAVWDELAECESSGDWAIDTGNGYHGGLQFDEGTWDDYGGNEYAPDAHQATKDEQIAVAEKVRDDRGGYGSWPACSQEQGLPQ